MIERKKDTMFVKKFAILRYGGTKKLIPLKMKTRYRAMFENYLGVNIQDKLKEIENKERR